MEDRKYFYALDGLRGIAAFIIAFIWHYRWNFNPQNGLPFEKLFWPFYQYGEGVVELFFMISGFTMAYCYTDKIFSKAITFKNYILKRLSHIYPIFFISTFAVIVLQYIHIKLTGITFIVSHFDFLHFVMNIFLVQNGIFGDELSFNGVAWCIPIEFACYIILYIILVLSNKNGCKAAHIYALFIVFWSIVLMFNLHGVPFLNTQNARGQCCFFLGALLHYLYIKKRDIRAINYLIFGSVILILAVMLQFDLSQNIVLAGIILKLVILPIVVWMAINIKTLEIILGCKMLRLLGKLSLSLYLWHFPAEIFISDLDNAFQLNIDYSSYIFYFTYMTFVLILSYASNRWIESINLISFAEHITNVKMGEKSAGH